MYIIIDLNFESARIIKSKKLLADILGCDPVTIRRNEKKLPYERAGYKVFAVKNGIETTKKYQMSYPARGKATQFKKISPN